MSDESDLFASGRGILACRQLVVRPWWIRRRRAEAGESCFDIAMSEDEATGDFSPLVVLVNRLSGGQRGEQIYRQCLRVLNVRQVFLLQSTGHLQWIFGLYRRLSSVRVVVCGGDGTVGWVVSTLADLYPQGSNPAVAVCPLGTGNDLSRVLGWGWTWKSGLLLSSLRSIPRSRPRLVDRWKIDFHPLADEAVRRFQPTGGRRAGCSPCCRLPAPRFTVDVEPLRYSKCRQAQNPQLINYLSLGLDGAVVLDFHERRLTDPSAFTSPWKNKFIYLNVARGHWKEFVFWRCWDLSSSVKLFCDETDFSGSLRHCQSLLILNIGSYGSGTRPWTGAFSRDGAGGGFAASSSDDERLEVLGLSALDMTLIHVGCRARRVTQCAEVRVELYTPMPVHIDGDPFFLGQPTNIRISHSGQVTLLERSHSQEKESRK